jgi:hypothetical protein
MKDSVDCSFRLPGEGGDGGKPSSRPPAKEINCGFALSSGPHAIDAATEPRETRDDDLRQTPRKK